MRLIIKKTYIALQKKLCASIQLGHLYSKKAFYMASKILLPVVGNKVYIFELEDVKRLRKLGIVGVLSGTLAAAPQQNVFLGLPLQLSIEDVIWLVVNGHGVLIDNLNYHQQPLPGSDFSISEWNRSNRICVTDEKHHQSLLKKLATLSLTDEQMELKRKQLQENKTENFVVIPNSTPLPQKDSYEITLEKFLPLKSEHNKLAENYSVYQAMKDQGFYLLPGIRFGGKYIGYPNDPLRYHAHFIINPANQFKLLDLVTGGRLATGVKKVWVIVGEVDSDESKELKDQKDDEFTVSDFTKETKHKMFSIEWAGFG